jgi:hypothetical protein
MKIDKMHTGHLRNDGHFQFFADFRDLVNEMGADKLKIAEQFAPFAALLQREDEALRKVNKSEFTARIQEADKARDEMFACMYEIVRVYLKHYHEEIRQAAARLKILFDTYKDIDKKNLIEQTSAITNIMQELNGKYSTDASAIGIGGWASQLEVRNDALYALVKERFDESAAKTDIVMKDARAEVDKVYKAVVERINALVIVEGPEAYENFIRRLNVVIAKHIQYMTADQGRRATKKGGNGEQPEPGENGGTEKGGEPKEVKE